MKKFQGIIESPTPPPINCFWLYNGIVRYFNNKTGKWESVNSSESNSDILKITIGEEYLNKVLSGEQVTIRNNKISLYANVLILESGKYSYYFNKVMQSNGTSQYITGNIHTKNHEFGNLGAIVSEGVITLTSVSVNYSNAIVELEIGDSNEIKEHNLNNLVQGHFFTHLDYGYGVGTFQTKIGGFARVTTTYGNEVFYSIKDDGSIIKGEDYIKPNEPYTIQLDSNDIGKPLEDVMASHILNCGEIIVNGVTGPITYTRSVDSTESMIYFISSKKDNSFQILTYNVSSKTITSAISKYAVPAATRSSIGGVKAMTNIADVVNGSTTQDTVDVLVGTVNSLLSQLRAVGLIMN